MSRRTLVLCVPLALLAGLPAAAPARGAQGDPPAAPPWMVAFEATEGQPIGMDASDIQAVLTKQMKSDWPKEKTWQGAWDKSFLLMTPAHKVDVPAFALSKYEVTNAQWEVFLRHRMEKLTTEEGWTLEQIVCDRWALDRDRQAREVQSGWMNLIAANEKVLLPVLNPTGKEGWDPLVERAGAAKLPKGLELSYPRYQIPGHWTNGRIPDHERRKPVRGLSWEQCVDFCEWAGFHLPFEAEWERAARGKEGRLFPWGNEWDGTKAVWKLFNEAARAAKAKGGTVEPLDRDPPEPVEVDSFAHGATPEGVLHMTGNVSEYMLNRSLKYPGSTTQNHFAGQSQIARGGNYEDRMETLLAADRNFESHQGALLASHSVSGYGFRLASYPVAGADIAASVHALWSDTIESDAPAHSQPLPPGIEDRKKAGPFLGFGLHDTAGVIERSLGSASVDHVFVTDAARGVAFLPVKGFPYEFVKNAADVSKFRGDPDRPLLLGLLTGTRNLGVVVRSAPAGGEPVDRTVAFRDPDLTWGETSSRMYTKADAGLLLVLEGERVAVYAPDKFVAGKARFRNAPLGYLAAPAVVESDRAANPSDGRMEEGATAVLTARIPLLAKDGDPQKGAPSIRVTIRVPVVPR